MSRTITKSDLDEAVNKVTEDIGGVIKEFAGNADKRFNHVGEHLGVVETRLDGVEHRLIGMDARLNGIEERLGSLDVKYERMVNLMDNLVAKIDDLNLIVEMRARDHEITRLKRWVEKIAKETGVKLEY